eukprot:gene16850-23082_t
MTAELSKVATITLIRELEKRFRCSEKKETRTIFFGPPGAGKGTQAPKIKDEYCLCHLSTGDMLRDAVRNGTEMGRKAKGLMDAGALVGDDVVVGIVSDAIKGPDCAKGFILDGFPRTVAQAKMLDEILLKQKLSVDKVINLAIDDELLIKRVTGRLIHPSSGRAYNIYFNPPKVAGKDDETGEPLIRRGDDTEEKLRTRLSEFHSKTIPVLKYYSTKVANIKADDDMNTITDNIRSALDTPAAPAKSSFF